MKSQAQWFAVSVVMAFRSRRGRQPKIPVHENVYLVTARSVAEARKKAERLGKAEEQELELDGRPARLTFCGVRKVISCAADPAKPGASTAAKLYDGVEATFSSFVVAGEKNLRQLVEGKAVDVEYEE